jgi:hypothetical protein
LTFYLQKRNQILADNRQERERTKKNVNLNIDERLDFYCSLELQRWIEGNKQVDFRYFDRFTSAFVSY